MTNGHSRANIEVMTFENHTECHCVLKSLVNSNNEASKVDLANDEPAQQIRVVERFNSVVTTTTQEPVRCRCPNHFNRTNDYLCKCDCPMKQSQNDICFKLKTGLEHFSISERRQV